MTFTHLDESGRARMVDVSHKHVTYREATARENIDSGPSDGRIISRATDVQGEVQPMSGARNASVAVEVQI